MYSMLRNLCKINSSPLKLKQTKPTANLVFYYRSVLCYEMINLR